MEPFLDQQALESPPPNEPNALLPDALFLPEARQQALRAEMAQYNNDHQRLTDAIYNSNAGGAGAAGRVEVARGAAGARGAAETAAAARPLGRGQRGGRECSEATACFLLADPQQAARGAYFVTPAELHTYNQERAEAARARVLGRLAVAAHFPVNRRIFQRARGDGMAVTGALLSAGIGSVIMEMARLRDHPVAVTVVDAVEAVFPPDAGEHAHPEWERYYALFRPFMTRLAEPAGERGGYGMHVSVHSAESNDALRAHGTAFANHYQRTDLLPLLPGVPQTSPGLRHARTQSNQRLGGQGYWVENSHPSARGQTLAGRRVAIQADAFLALGAFGRQELSTLPHSIRRLAVADAHTEHVAEVAAAALWTYEELGERLAYHMANNRGQLLEALRASQWPSHHLHILVTEIATRSSRLELTFNHLLERVRPHHVTEAWRQDASAAANMPVHHPEALPSAGWTLRRGLRRLSSCAGSPPTSWTARWMSATTPPFGVFSTSWGGW